MVISHNIPQALFNVEFCIILDAADRSREF